MNLDELQSVQSRERQTDSLQQLRASFYKDAAEFVQELREERERAAERAEDPFDSPDVNRLSDDIRTAEQTVEAIYERRVGKVVKMASLAAADMPTEQEGLTEEEQELFETMVTAIEDHREAILNVLGGGSPAGTVAETPADRDEREVTAATTDPDDEGLDAAAVMGEDEDAQDDGPQTHDATDPPDSVPSDVEPGEETVPGQGGDHESAPAPPDERPRSPERDSSDGGDVDGETNGDSDVTGDSDANAGPDTCGSRDEDEADSAETAGDDTNLDGTDGGDAIEDDRVTVRITEDVGEIFGVDEREYDLAADDVVTLPATNAQPLIDRDAAEPLE